MGKVIVPKNGRKRGYWDNMVSSMMNSSFIELRSGTEKPLQLQFEIKLHGFILWCNRMMHCLNCCLIVNRKLLERDNSGHSKDQLMTCIIWFNKRPQRVPRRSKRAVLFYCKLCGKGMQDGKNQIDIEGDQGIYLYKEYHDRRSTAIYLLRCA